MSLFKDIVKSILPTNWVVFRATPPLSEKIICLTFDDGPHPINTLKIQDILNEKNIKATFFAQGCLVDLHPEIIATVASHGHQIANHGYEHVSCKELSVMDYIENTQKTELSISRALGFNGSNKIFRPPYGCWSLPTLIRLLIKGYRFIMWSVDSCDSSINTQEELSDYIRSLAIDSGDILLFHDDYDHTLLALPSILEHLTNKGFSFVTINELLTTKAMSS